jgi:hypothetical protein
MDEDIKVEFIADDGHVAGKVWIKKEDWDFMVQFRKDRHVAWMKENADLIIRLINKLEDNG